MRQLIVSIFVFIVVTQSVVHAADEKNMYVAGGLGFNIAPSQDSIRTITIGSGHTRSDTTAYWDNGLYWFGSIGRNLNKHLSLEFELSGTQNKIEKYIINKTGKGTTVLGWQWVNSKTQS